MIKYQIIELVANSLIIAFSLAAVIFTFGVVWRTEKELDISYKFFLGAIISFTAFEILELFAFDGRIVIAILVLAFRFLFSAFFLAGIFTARDLLRKMDGEKGGDIQPTENEQNIIK
jgi:hypothetical protein